MIRIIAAVGRNGEIGLNGRLPWCFPEDLAFFRKQTMGAAVLMGRATYDSIGKPLPGRYNMVVTNSVDTWTTKGNAVFINDNPATVCQRVKDFGCDVYVIGGSRVYYQTIDHADECIVTHIDADFPGADARFPMEPLFHLYPKREVITKLSGAYTATVFRYSR